MRNTNSREISTMERTFQGKPDSIEKAKLPQARTKEFNGEGASEKNCADRPQKNFVPLVM